VTEARKAPRLLAEHGLEGVYDEMLPHWNRHLAGEITIEQYRELWRVLLEPLSGIDRKQKAGRNNMDSVSFSFSVPGKPQQKGSKQAFARMGKNGRPFATLVDSNKEAMNHQNWIKACALAEVPLDWERDGPVKVSISFYFQRPKSHMLKAASCGKVHRSITYRNQTSTNLFGPFWMG
jgi:hypothetical protein